MTITIIILLAVGFCIMVGFAARQMQDLRESDTKIEELRYDIQDLKRENEDLRRDNRDHEANLEMVLNELLASNPEEKPNDVDDQRGVENRTGGPRSRGTSGAY